MDSLDSRTMTQIIGARVAGLLLQLRLSIRNQRSKCLVIDYELRTGTDLDEQIKIDRVMVDFGSYLQHGPASTESKFPPMGDLQFVEDDDEACRCGTCMGNEKLKENQKLHYDRVASGDGWEETQYLICPPRVLGYHLKGKRWVELEVEKITDIANLEDGSSFENLELARPQKNLIKQLVKCHASDRNTKERSMTDLMQGKGNGLVILLHGMPCIRWQN